jgi:hypothetical protein
MSMGAPNPPENSANNCRLTQQHDRRCSSTSGRRRNEKRQARLFGEVLDQLIEMQHTIVEQSFATLF